LKGKTAVGLVALLLAFSQILLLVFTGRNDIFKIAQRAGADGHVFRTLDPDLLVENKKTLIEKNSKTLKQ
jgi:hypothetical protein